MLQLRRLREEHGMTAKEVGEKCDVSEATICYVETGKRKPSYELLLKLSELFDCSVDYLIGNEPQGNIAAVAIPDNDRKVFQWYSMATKEEREMIFTFLSKYDKSDN